MEFNSSEYSQSLPYLHSQITILKQLSVCKKRRPQGLHLSNMSSLSNFKYHFDLHKENIVHILLSPLSQLLEDQTCTVGLNVTLSFSTCSFFPSEIKRPTAVRIWRIHFMSLSSG